MNKKFVKLNLKIDEIVRITTSVATGIIGRVIDVDEINDGLILEGIKEEHAMSQIDNIMDYERVLIPIEDIKYIFVINLESKK